MTDIMGAKTYTKEELSQMTPEDKLFKVEGYILKENCNCREDGMCFFQGRYVPCPNHYDEVQAALRTQLLVSDTDAQGNKYMTLLGIPQEYAEVIGIDIDGLFKPNLRLINTECDKDSVVHVKDILMQIYNSVAISEVPYPQSVYISAYPMYIDLNQFVYSLLMLAYRDKKLKCVPLISVNTLESLVTFYGSKYIVETESDIVDISLINPQASLGAELNFRSKKTYFDYITAPICCISDDGATTHSALYVLAGLLRERASRGLPTYIFSTTFFDSLRESVLYNKRGQEKHRLNMVQPFILLQNKFATMGREHKWLNPRIYRG